MFIILIPMVNCMLKLMKLFTLHVRFIVFALFSHELSAIAAGRTGAVPEICGPSLPREPVSLLRRGEL